MQMLNKKKTQFKSIKHSRLGCGEPNLLFIRLDDPGDEYTLKLPTMNHDILSK